jgi:RNA polymerase sigma-70 factor (ECF subfamily)
MIVWFRRSAPSPGATDRVSIKAQRFEQLIELAKQLDSEALGEVYQPFLPVVYGYVAARIADRRQAEDITSEVFVSMLKSISRLRATDETGFAAWILRITRFRMHRARLCW